MKRKLPTVMWAGFIDGEIDIGAVHSAMLGDFGYLYPTKKAAQRMYEDVRRVEIREVKGRERK
jgi:hypothetical protein